MPIWLVPILIVLFLVWNAVVILSEYERAVVFRLGRLTGARGPGLVLVIPGIERYVRIDMRTFTPPA